MGLTSLPEVGAGEDLGPVKQDRPLKYPDELREILAAEHNAAMQALQGVCAEVGLHDGSTVGSLVERVTTLEDAPPGSGDVSGPGSSVIGRVATWADTDGENIADGGMLLSDLATTTALSDHTTSTSNPHSVTATQVGALPVIGTQRTSLVSTTVGTSQSGEQLLVAVNGSDLYVTLVDGSTAGQVSIVTRGDLGGGGDVVIQGQDGDHVITGPTILTRGLDTIEVRLTSIDGSTYYWATARKDTYEDMDVRATHTASTRTVAARDRGTRTPLDPTSNTIAVTLPHTLPVGFVCEFVALNVTNAISFAGSGGLVLTYYGSSTITAGDIIRVSVESATVCRVEVVKTGASSATPTAITVYDTASSGNYTIPTGAKAVYRRVIGAGGGGGGGASQTGATARAGGAGGGGGAVAEGWISGAELAGGTIAYVVGAGGTVGAGRTGGSAGDGSDGGAGGNSNAGGLFAYGGGGGRRGTATAAAGSGGGGGGTGSVGAAGTFAAVSGGAPGGSSAQAIGGQGAQAPVTQNGGSAEYGGGGGAGHSATPVNYVGGSSLYGGGGGGQGGGAIAAGPATVAATAGGASGNYTAGGGGAAGTSGAAPTAGTVGTAGDSTKCGSGGGGGGASVTANTAGADGGAGGAAGGGGGGGGCGEGTGDGGDGGIGGAGRVEFYAFF